MNASYTDAEKTEIAHVPASRGRAVKIGEPVHAPSTGSLRYARMRMHTALHLLSAALPYPVTGGSVGEAERRLDFDIPKPVSTGTTSPRRCTKMIAAEAEVRSRWITDAELAANPGLIKTMTVKPPTGTGRVRLIEIGGDRSAALRRHACARNGEIGDVRGDADRKEGQAEPSRADCAGVRR